MADGDGATVDVDDVGVPAHVLVDGAGLGREGLVGLDEIEVLDLPASLLQRGARGGDGTRAHDRRIDADARPGCDAGERLQAAAAGFRLAHQQHDGGAVIDAGGIGGGHRAVLGEGRLQLLHAVEGHALLDVLVLVHHHVALAGGDGDRGYLVLELAGGLGGLGLVLALHRELVLHVAGDLPLLGDVLGGGAHVVAVEGIPEAVLDHGVDHRVVAHLHAITQVGGMRRAAHRFLAAGGDDLGIARHDLLHAQRHGAEAGAAELVDAPGRAFLGDAGMDGGLAGGVLALAGGEDLAEDHLLHFGGLDLGAFHGGLQGDGAQEGGRHARQRAVEGPYRRARRRDDDNPISRPGHDASLLILA